MVHAVHMGTQVGTSHVTAVRGGLLLSMCCSYLRLVAGSRSSSIDRWQVHCAAAGYEGRCQLWCAAKVQVDVAGEHILPGVALWDCLCAWHLQADLSLQCQERGTLLSTPVRLSKAVAL